MRSHDISKGTLTAGRVARFWLPLEATWLMMAAEGPFVAAVIARLADPKENLAAFAVASALAWIVESPIIMMLSASNALVRDGVAYRKLRRFSMALNAAVTVVMAALIAPPVFDIVARGAMGLTPEVAGLAGRSMIFLILWPAAIGFRRFYQGILIGNHLPRRVAYGTVVRLASMAATALFLYLCSSLPGACVGTAALSAGVVMEALASRVMAGPLVKRLLTVAEPGMARLFSNRELAAFAGWVYVIAVCAPMLLSGSRRLLLFGLANLAAVPYTAGFGHFGRAVVGLAVKGAELPWVAISQGRAAPAAQLRLDHGIGPAGIGMGPAKEGAADGGKPTGGQAIGQHLGETEGDREVVLLGALAVPQLPDAEVREQRRVAGQDAEPAHAGVDFYVDLYLRDARPRAA